MIDTQSTGNDSQRKRLLSRRPLVLLGCLALVLIIPFPTEVVPEWRIRIVDEAGKPFAEKFVRQGWAHYSLEFCCGDTEDRWTDGNGYVVFPSVQRSSVSPQQNSSE